MENKQFNNLADKAVCDDELEQVSGGAKLYKKCKNCGEMVDISATVCPKCHQPV